MAQFRRAGSPVSAADINDLHEQLIDINTPLTGNTTLAWPAAAGRYHIVTSASAVALTLPTGAIVNGSAIRGVNMGAGALSFAPSGGDTIVLHAILPANVDQYSPFELRRVTGGWVRVA